MDWYEMFVAFAAGGLAGNLVTVSWRAWLTKRNGFKKWRIEERYKLFSQLLTLVTYTPTDEKNLNKWTYDIRDLSLRLHILFDGGTAPQDLADSIEHIFQLAKLKKNGDDGEEWSGAMRSAVREMRKCMAKNIL